MGLHIPTIPFQQSQLHNINVLGWQLTQVQKYDYENILSHVVALNLNYIL